jgi:hypothetical protein
VSGESQISGERSRSTVSATPSSIAHRGSQGGQGWLVEPADVVGLRQPESLEPGAQARPEARLEFPDEAFGLLEDDCSGGLELHERIPRHPGKPRRLRPAWCRSTVPRA